MNQRQRQFKRGLSALKQDLVTRASRRVAKRSDKICAIRPALYNAHGMPETNQIIAGNSIDVLNNGPEGWIDLVFADPPFNIGYLYHGYEDRRKTEDYLQFSKDWMQRRPPRAQTKGKLLSGDWG